MMEKIIEQSAELSDFELIDRILSGEKRAFEWIIRRYNQTLFRIGRSMLHNEAEAEDAMQSCYIKAFEHLHAFERRSSFATWLTRIMINECKAQLLKMNRTREEMNKPTHSQAMPATPDHVLVNKELGHALEHAISNLPEKYRLVFMLREIEGVSIKETAEILDLEESNVKVRLNRAKSMLRTDLHAYGKDQVYAFHLSRCDRMVANVMAQLGIS